MLCSPLVLVADLEGQLTGVAQHHHRHLYTGGAALSQPSATKPPVASMQPCSSNITGSASCIASPVSSKHLPACNCGCTDPPCPQAVCLPPTYLPIRGLKLLQRGDDKHGGLAHARLGLADHVHAKDGLGDALVLHCDMAAGDKGGREAGLVGRKARARQAACHITPLPCSMLGTAPHAPGHPARSRTKQAPGRTLGGVLKAAVLDGTQQLRLEQEVLEAAAVNAHVALLHLRHAGNAAHMMQCSRPRPQRAAAGANSQLPAAPGRPPWRPRRPWPPHLPPHSPAAASGGGHCTASARSENTGAQSGETRQRRRGGKEGVQKPEVAGSRIAKARRGGEGLATAPGRKKRDLDAGQPGRPAPCCQPLRGACNEILGESQPGQSALRRASPSAA